MNLVKNILSFLWHHKIITAIAIVIVLILGFIFRPKPAAPVATQEVEPTNIIQSVSVSGTTVAKNSVNLTFPVAGTISWVGVKVGDTVNAYQTIATLDQRTALKNLQQSLIAYSIQRNTFDQTISDNNNIQNPDQAGNDKLKRILQNNQYNLDNAVNSVELQDLARQQSILTTPIAGIVTRADATAPGVTAVPTVIFSVADPNSIVFSMDVDEADIGKIQMGQTAHLTLDAYPNETITEPVNFIDFVSHTTANGGNAYSVQIPLTNNNSYKYRVGMNGNADIIIQQRENVLTVPLSSLTEDGAVYVREGKKFVKKKVVLGIQNDTEAQVLSGLKKGDFVAIDPTQIPKNQK